MADPYAGAYEEAGRAWNVDPVLIRAIHAGESANSDGATSYKGAQGRGQFMPETARAIGMTDTRDPLQSIFGTAKLMAQNLDDAQGDVPTALKLYQGGPNRNGWGPQNAAYPAYIMGHYQRLAGQGGVQQVAAADPAPSRDGVIAAAVGRARQGAAAVPHDAPDDVLLGALTGSAKTAPAASGQAAPDLSDDALLGRLTAGAKPPAVSPPAAAPKENPAFPAPILDTPEPAPNSPSQDAMVRNAATGVGNVLSATGQGIAAGFGNSMPGLAPEQAAALQRMGIMLPVAGGGTPMQRLNDAGINALAPVVDVAGRSLNGLLQGYQRGVSQAGAEVGQPQLGRDLAALPEAFPFGHSPGVPSVTAQGPVVANRLAGQAAAALPLTQDAMTELRLGGVPSSLSAKASFTEQAAAGKGIVQNRLAPAAAEAGNPLAAPRVPVTAEPLPAPGQPGSMGAAATPGTLSNLTPAQELAYRSTAEGQKLLEPQPVGRDLNAYVPGVDPTLAQTEQNVNISRELKALNITSPAVSAQAKEIAATHNAARSAHFEGLAGSAVDVENARSARSAQAETNLAAAWQNKTDANAQPVLDVAKGILDSPDGRRPVVRNAINSVTAELTGPDGKLLTDPEMLYGVRKHIDDLLSKENGGTDPLSKRAQANLLEVKAALDSTIEQAAPGFGKYLSDYSEASRPIDAMEVLQGHETKLYNAQNQMEYSRVQNMMRQVVDSRSAPGLNAYKSIPDETMSQLFALRDDLRRAATEKELAKAPGSDTAQNFADVARLGGNVLLHGAANLAAPGLGSLGINALKTAISPITAARAARKQVERGNALLQPDRTAEPLRNPLAGP